MIYPSLPARRDYLLFRLSGSGLGNCLFTYFHAVARSYRTGERLVAPRWGSIRIGPILRGETSMRRYATMLRNHPDEVTGVRRLLILATRWRRRKVIDYDLMSEPIAVTRDLTVVERSFTFVGLTPHRDAIRLRLLQLFRQSRTGVECWGVGDYAAIHIRMGDFAEAVIDDHLRGRATNSRIPLTWFQGIVAAIRSARPGLEIRIFSDGRADELATISSMAGVTLMSGQIETDDLFDLSGACLLVGSQSTFSHWAAFLGGMPTIWIKTPTVQYRDPAGRTPTLFVGTDFADVPNFVHHWVRSPDSDRATLTDQPLP
jgi:hypothetical protein